MNSFTSSSFWHTYEKLPADIQNQTDKQYELWKENPYHPSLHFKCVDRQKNIWSVRITRNYRALGIRDGDEIVWFWIGDHDRYEKRV